MFLMYVSGICFDFLFTKKEIKLFVCILILLLRVHPFVKHCVTIKVDANL
jgi:hypothetical protein